MNDAACRLAHEVAGEGDALVAGGISQTPTFLSGLGKQKTQAEFKKQVDVFVENKVDFLIAEVRNFATAVVIVGSFRKLVKSSKHAIMVQT